MKPPLQSGATEALGSVDLSVLDAPSVVLRVLEGPDAGTSVTVNAPEASVGTHEANTVRVTDRAVSRFHFDLRFGPRGLTLKDLGSTNGTFVSGLRVQEVFVTPGVQIRVGVTTIELASPKTQARQTIAASDRLGRLIGASIGMRRLFADIARIAASELPVLILGETGTGKELVAREIHERSPRRDRPFVIVDAGAIASELVESELFGHEKGAFTGALRDRMGAFEAANGGTLFLDEIGELDLALQPRLLRAAEAKQIKRVGSNQYRDVDVRIVAATHRDLRTAVNEGTFREDLFYRLAVATLSIPPLRERAEDIPLLIARFHEDVTEKTRGASRQLAIDAEKITRLKSLPWHGNCRELRNFVERAVTFEGDIAGMMADVASPPAQSERLSPATGTEIRHDLPYKDAKALWIDIFEREFVGNKLRENDRNMTRAARAMEIDRAYVLRLIKKHGL